MEPATAPFLHAQHTLWEKEHARWLEELERWNEDYAGMLALLKEIEAAVARHRGALDQHREQILGHEFSDAFHDVRLIRNEVDEPTLEKLQELHTQEGAVHADQRRAHEDMRRIHHRVMGRLDALAHVTLPEASNTPDA